MQLFRLVKILWVVFRFGLDEFVLNATKLAWLQRVTHTIFFWRDLSKPRAQRLREALESLGPIFVKFGQVLSTRPDLFPADIIAELSKLQDRVPPFSSDVVVATLEKTYGKPVDEVFASFEREPVASASVAQVHFGVLPDGRECAIKVLRPGIDRVISHDLALLDTIAMLIERLFKEGKRLKPREVVAEFEKHLADELDLIREASNASQLRRNFIDGRLLLIPEVYWDWCASNVMVMQRMYGVGVSNIEELRRKGIDIPRLSRDGVEIFFTQVFRDGFFHADMHPGNILVADDGRYVGVDFGIMGTLNDEDKHYLAVNFIAFFNRDYHRVAVAHVEAGWVPPGTRVDEFESAIRAVCEPIFDKPLKDISFGKVLLRLFQVSRRFQMEIQPQLVMLQKTLLNVEGLGRQLDGELDLWKTAKPILERWMQQQVGWEGFAQRLRDDAPHLSRIVPQIPRLVHAALAREPNRDVVQVLERIEREQRNQKRWLMVLAVALAAEGVLAVAWLIVRSH